MNGKKSAFDELRRTVFFRREHCVYCPGTNIQTSTYGRELSFFLFQESYILSLTVTEAQTTLNNFSCFWKKLTSSYLFWATWQVERSPLQSSKCTYSFNHSGRLCYLNSANKKAKSMFSCNFNFPYQKVPLKQSCKETFDTKRKVTAVPLLLLYFGYRSKYEVCKGKPKTSPFLETGLCITNSKRKATAVFLQFFCTQNCSCSPKKNTNKKTTVAQWAAAVFVPYWILSFW